MRDFPIEPPLAVKDTPRPRRLNTLLEIRAYLDEMLRLGRPAPWRELWHRLEAVTTEEEAAEVVGALRELLALEELLVPPELPLLEPEGSPRK
jgi:hypothetical protein